MAFKLFFFIFLAPLLVRALEPVFNDDVLGLIVFKAGLRDPKAKLTSWSEDDDNPCSWIGVKCDPRTNRVSELVLDGFSLSGHVGRGLLRLQFLQILSLANNNFTGTINPDLPHLGSLQVIDLSQNSLSGPIPDEFFMQCGSLRVVSFARNNLTGQIPQSLSLCQTLVAVNFSSNQLSGKLPSGIWYLRGLQALDLSDNLLEGEVPEGMENLYDLRVINFRKNWFSGKLPWDIGSCLLLKLLDFSENFFSGSIPESIQRLSSCSSLSLQGNSFAGQIPNWFGDLRSLEMLDISGKLPSWIFKLGIQSVSLSGNRLSGSAEYSSLTSMEASNGGLQVLDLSSNEFSDVLPSDIGVLSSLQFLNMSGNHLLGSIPASIGVVSLKELRLQKNFLTGKIPSQIEKCSSLTSLMLSQNNLTGPIPAAIANLTNLQYVDLSLNKFSGSLPKELTNLSHLLYFNVSHNHLQGAAAFIAIGVIAVTVLNIHARSSVSRSAAPLELSGGEDYSCSPTTDPNYGKLVMFSGDADFGAGTQALLNKDCELGRGGFGVVYRTVLRDGRSVAIKKLTVSSLIKSQEDFEREVKGLGKIKHHNLVALEGYYWTPSLQLLIYEYIPCGSLYKNLHDGLGKSCLTWRQRFNIILGMAKGLAHLHQINIIHYNLKSTNVLIDSSGAPKVGDFGLARLLPTLDRCILSSKIQSALGYMAPEFACQTVKITEKCDVYGFGILVLEVVTGKRPVEYMEDDVVVLCDMVRGALEEGRVEECLDQKLLGNFPADEAIPVVKLGLICASQVPSNRPDMNEVINILELIQCPSEVQEELE
ncbi:leucine-rich repeat receptor-like protein kinase PXC2 [Prunus yedoensis var. nudiflora]|uniref:Leucine-rich repeat receptor-like protein kinase PXC2 n=1 Tax=Prunus yedoensis var. nudiflora TaxID=2094558 RepID=A0A314Y0X1_PRUYE|nr:leucine-rich repeat receptor-like protein kinase PXC2 [Prunus yedoensis var. nudiflora]